MAETEDDEDTEDTPVEEPDQPDEAVAPRAVQAPAVKAKAQVGTSDKVTIVGSDGRQLDIPGHEYKYYKDKGYRLQTYEESLGEKMKKEYGDHPIRTAVESAANVATFGGSNALAVAIGGDPEREQLEQDARLSPWASFGGGAVGGLLAVAAPFGLGDAGAAVGAKAAGLAADVGGSALQQGIVGLGARAGTEGAILGAGGGVGNLALDDKPLTIGKVFHELGMGAIVGGTSGAVLGGAGGLLAPAARAVADYAAEQAASLQAVRTATETFPEIDRMTKLPELQEAQRVARKGLEADKFDQDRALRKARAEAVDNIHADIEKKAEDLYVDFKKFARQDNMQAWQSPAGVPNEEQIATRLGNSQKAVSKLADLPEKFARGERDKSVLDILEGQQSVYSEVIKHLEEEQRDILTARSQLAKEHAKLRLTAEVPVDAGWGDKSLEEWVRDTPDLDAANKAAGITPENAEAKSVPMRAVRPGQEAPPAPPPPEPPVDEAIYNKAVRMVAEKQQGSAASIARRLRIGPERAEAIVARMEKDGYLAASDPARPNYREVLIKPEDAPPEYKPPGKAPERADYRDAVELVRKEGQASPDLLYRKMNVRYARAADIIEQMEREGVIGPAKLGEGRTVYPEGGAPEPARVVDPSDTQQHFGNHETSPGLVEGMERDPAIVAERNAERVAGKAPESKPELTEHEQNLQAFNDHFQELANKRNAITARLEEAKAFIAKNVELRNRIKGIMAERATPMSPELDEIIGKQNALARPALASSPYLDAIANRMEQIRDSSGTGGLAKRYIKAKAGAVLGSVFGPHGAVAGAAIGGLAGDGLVSRLGGAIANGTAKTAKGVAKMVGMLATGAERGAKASGPVGDVLAHSLAEAKPGRPPKAYATQSNVQKRISEVHNALANPDVTRSKLHANLGGLSAIHAGLAAGVVERTMTALEFIQSKIPAKPAIPGVMSFGPQKHQLSDIETAKLARSIAGVYGGPPLILQEIMRGKLTPEHVEAVKAVYPEWWAEAKTEIIKMVADGVAASMPYSRRLNMSIAFETTVDPSMAMVPQLQQHFAKEAGTEGGQKPPNMAALGSKSTPGDVKATQSQRISDA